MKRNGEVAEGKGERFRRVEEQKSSREREAETRKEEAKVQKRRGRKKEKGRLLTRGGGLSFPSVL